MFYFFDKVYYNLCKFYSKSDKAGAGVTALIVLSAIQFCNITIILLGILIALNSNMPEVSNMEIYGVSVLVSLLILNFIRYNKLNFQVLKQKNGNDNKHASSWAILYLFTSIILFFALAIFAHSHLKIT